MRTRPVWRWTSGNSLISSAFRPLLGDPVDGPLGKSIDILAIFATLFGSVVSLGMGALQVNRGLKELWRVPDSTALALSIIATLTVLFVSLRLYWAWWISWTPFVGTFIARISRGRTIREFIVGVIIAPSLVSVVWFAILGGTALNQEMHGADLASAVAQGEEAGLFATLRHLPWFSITSVLVIVLVGLFFVSGADAASVVLGMLSCRGI